MAKNERSHPILGEVDQLLADGNSSAALAALNEFLDGHPDNAEALLLRAQVYFTREKLVLAAQDVARAETLEPDLDELYFTAIRIAIANREYERALDLTDAAFDRSDGRTRLYAAIPMMLIPQRFENDFSDPKWDTLEGRILDRWLEKAPNDANARRSLARHLLHRLNPNCAQALEVATQLVKEDPGDQDRQELLAEAALKTGQLDVAEAAWLKAIELGTEPKSIRTSIFEWAKLKTGGPLIAWCERSKTTRQAGAFLYLLLTVLLVSLIPLLGRPIPLVFAIPLGLGVLLALYVPALRPLAILRLRRHAGFSALASKSDEILAFMVLGLIALLLVYVVAFPLSPQSLRVGLAAAVIPPILSIFVIDLIRDLYTENPLRMKGSGGMVALGYLGSFALLLVALLS